MKKLPFYLFWASITTVIILSLTAAGCTTPKVVTVTEYRDRVITDTVTRDVIDSVYVAHYVREKGDTMYITDTIIKWRWRESAKEHTEFIHDSIPYAVEVQVPVRTRNGYERFTSWGFWILLVLALACIAWRLVKKYYLRL